MTESKRIVLSGVNEIVESAARWAILKDGYQGSFELKTKLIADHNSNDDWLLIIDYKPRNEPEGKV